MFLNNIHFWETFPRPVSGPYCAAAREQQVSKQVQQAFETQLQKLLSQSDADGFSSDQNQVFQDHLDDKI